MISKYNILPIILFIILVFLLKKSFQLEYYKDNSEKLYFNFYHGIDNFGDSVNHVFWEKMTNKRIYENRNKKHYLTTGSIISLANDKSIIFGTGFISENSTLVSKNNIKKITPHVISVRGPKTRNKLLSMNIFCPKNYGDPLILFPCIYIPINQQSNKIGIIPHYIDFNNSNVHKLINNLEKKNYKTKKINIQVGNNYKKFIDNINECRTIISSSLHGVIMGIVYKKPTIFITFSDKVIGKEFKFYDFFESIGTNYEIKKLYDDTVLDNIINVNYNNLNRVSLKLLKNCPFIDSNRKKILSENYKKFYK